jgi:hypothetical protein
MQSVEAWPENPAGMRSGLLIVGTRALRDRTSMARVPQEGIFYVVESRPGPHAVEVSAKPRRSGSRRDHSMRVIPLPERGKAALERPRVDLVGGGLAETSRVLPPACRKTTSQWFRPVDGRHAGCSGTNRRSMKGGRGEHPRGFTPSLDHLDQHGIRKVGRS